MKSRIADKHPNDFGLIFDGWTCNREHYIAISATWFNKEKKIVQTHIHSKHFDNGVVKLQRNQESKLSRDEKEAVKCFLINPNASVDELTEETNNETNLLAELQRKVEETVTSQTTAVTKYEPTFHVSGHTVIVESLFSYAGHIMTPYRRHMDPSTFEMLLMLKMNKDLYNAFTLDEIIREFGEEEPVANNKKRSHEEAMDVTDNNADKNA